MKKKLLIVVCCMLLCGCTKKIKVENDLKVERKNDKYSIEGSFFNKNKDCGIYTVTFKFQNGNTIKYYNSVITVLIDNDIYEFSIDIDDDNLNAISDLDKYKIKISKIKCSN